MQKVLAIIAKCENEIVSVKLMFDSRVQMPQIREIKKIVKEYLPQIKSFTLINPPLNYKGEFTGNYFDVLSYKGSHSFLDFELKEFYSNMELIEDFKKNPNNIWKNENQQTDSNLMPVECFDKIIPVWGGSWDRGTLSDDYSSFKINFNDIYKTNLPIITSSSVVWFLSKDFENTEYFHDLTAFDSAIGNDDLTDTVQKIFFKNKYAIVAISNNCNKINDSDTIYYDKTFDLKDILKYNKKNNFKGTVNQYFRNSLFYPKIRDIGISWSWK